MSIEPAVPTPLRWSEVPITFSHVDKWTSFSEPGRFPLVLKPVVAGSKLNKVLIDGGSGLNVLFTKTLKKMKLDITHMLTKSNTPFYGIVPVTRLSHWAQWSCQLPSGSLGTTMTAPARVIATALVPVVAAATARVLLVLATDGIVFGVGLFFFILPGSDHILEVGDGLGAATTEVFKGAAVVEAVLEEIDDLLVGDIDYGSALVEEAAHVREPSWCLASTLRSSGTP
jgi:hypothetical protein